MIKEELTELMAYEVNRQNVNFGGNCEGCRIFGTLVEYIKILFYFELLLLFV